MTNEWEGLRLSDILLMGQRALEEDRVAAEAEAQRKINEAHERYDAAWAAACAPVYENLAQLRPWIVLPPPFEFEKFNGNCFPKTDELIQVRIPGFSMMAFKVSQLGSIYRFTDYSTYRGSDNLKGMDYPVILVYPVDGGAKEFTLKFFHKALATARQFYLDAYPEEDDK